MAVVSAAGGAESVAECLLSGGRLRADGCPHIFGVHRSVSIVVVAARPDSLIILTKNRLFLGLIRI